MKPDFRYWFHISRTNTAFVEMRVDLPMNRKGLLSLASSKRTLAKALDGLKATVLRHLAEDLKERKKEEK